MVFLFDSSGATQWPAPWWCSTVVILRRTWPPSSSVKVLMWERSISSMSSAHPRRRMTELDAPCSSPPVFLQRGGCLQTKTKALVRAAGRRVCYGTSSRDYRRLWLVRCAVTGRSVQPSVLVVTWSAVNSALPSFRWTEPVNVMHLIQSRSSTRCAPTITRYVLNFDQIRTFIEREAG